MIAAFCGPFHWPRWLSLGWFRSGEKEIWRNLVYTSGYQQVAGTLPGRLEIWQRAIYVIQDFPFTGIGMGTFGPVAQTLYPFFGTNANALVPHAHNILPYSSC